MRVHKPEIPDISLSFRSAHEGVVHAVSFMRTALSTSRFSIPRGSDRHLEMRRDLPYVIHTTNSLTQRILVNREYKPLGNPGTNASHWVKYEDWNSMHVSLSLDQIASVVSQGLEHGLYADGNQPWSSRRDAEAYLRRIELLATYLKPKIVRLSDAKSRPAAPPK
jgi:hypothetical protein